MNFYLWSGLYRRAWCCEISPTPHINYMAVDLAVDYWKRVDNSVGDPHVTDWKLTPLGLV